MDILPRTDQLFSTFKGAHKASYAKGEVIQASDGALAIHYLASGYVKRYLIADTGAAKIQSIYAPGYLFPLTLVFKSLYDLDIYEGKETLYYKAFTDVTLYSMDQTQFKQSVSSNPLLYSEILYEAGLRLHSNIQWLENSALKTSYDRLVHQLIYFAGQFGQTTPVGVRLLFPLTHQDLADILGMARETVSRHMIVLTDKGLIRGGKNLIISDVVSLRAEIGK